MLIHEFMFTYIPVSQRGSSKDQICKHVPVSNGDLTIQNWSLRRRVELKNEYPGFDFGIQSKAGFEPSLERLKSSTKGSLCSLLSRSRAWSSRSLRGTEPRALENSSFGLHKMVLSRSPRLLKSVRLFRSLNLSLGSYHRRLRS